jgi:Domain of unknown function (DUF3597)
MSIFGSILAKIFPSSHPAVAATSDGAQVTQPAQSAEAPPTPAAAPAPAPMPPVDVEQILTAMPGAAKLNWRTSIVDLMKLLDLDSSLGARKQLAGELHYAGDTNDSAAMNIWLHKQVMIKLAENGGKVPDDLRS